MALAWTTFLSACGGMVGPGGEGNDPSTSGGGGTGVGSAPPPGPVVPAMCRDRQVVRPGRAPLRRLTRFEYNNTVRDLLGDATGPASALPAEELGNGFGNDAAGQSVSSLLAEQYATVAEGIAARATQTPAALARLAPCAGMVNAAGEEGCARRIIEGFTPRAFRRPLAPGEVDPLLALYRSTRALEGATFASAIAAVLEAVLQAPDFLYRIERGVPDPARPELRRPSGDEMATRLSYLLWGSMPDEPLRLAARRGGLATAAGVAGAGHPHAGRSARAPGDPLLLRQPAADRRPVGSRARRDAVPDLHAGDRLADAGGDPAPAGARDLRGGRHLAGRADRAAHLRQRSAGRLLQDPGRAGARLPEGPPRRRPAARAFSPTPACWPGPPTRTTPTRWCAARSWCKSCSA